jgi:putative FmdB family regulatory protein
MPHYVFSCLDCQNKFTQFLHIDDLEQGQAACPNCGSKRVIQEVAEFSAVTSKKS